MNTEKTAGAEEIHWDAPKDLGKFLGRLGTAKVKEIHTKEVAQAVKGRLLPQERTLEAVIRLGRMVQSHPEETGFDEEQKKVVLGAYDKLKGAHVRMKINQMSRGPLTRLFRWVLDKIWDGRRENVRQSLINFMGEEKKFFSLSEVMQKFNTKKQAIEKGWVFSDITDIEKADALNELFKETAKLLEKGFEQGFIDADPAELQGTVFKCRSRATQEKVGLVVRLKNLISSFKSTKKANKEKFKNVVRNIFKDDESGVLFSKETIKTIKGAIVAQLPKSKENAKEFFAEINSRLTVYEESSNISERSSVTSLKKFVQDLRQLFDTLNKLQSYKTKELNPQWHLLTREAVDLYLCFQEEDRDLLFNRYGTAARDFLKFLFSKPINTELQREVVEEHEEVAADVVLKVAKEDQPPITVSKKEINQWAQACSSKAIRGTFGRRGEELLLIDGASLGLAPPGGDDAKQLAKVYLISKKLVDTYMEKNPEAKREDVQKMVDELLLRETIDYGIYEKITFFANLVCSISLGRDKNAVQRFIVEKGKIVCLREDTLSFADNRTLLQDVIPKKKVVFMTEISPGYDLKSTWVDRMEVSEVVPEKKPEALA